MSFELLASLRIITFGMRITHYNGLTKRSVYAQGHRSLTVSPHTGVPYSPVYSPFIPNEANGVGLCR